MHFFVIYVGLYIIFGDIFINFISTCITYICYVAIIFSIILFIELHLQIFWYKFVNIQAGLTIFVILLIFTLLSYYYSYLMMVLSCFITSIILIFSASSFIATFDNKFSNLLLIQIDKLGVLKLFLSIFDFIFVQLKDEHFDKLNKLIHFYSLGYIYMLRVNVLILIIGIHLFQINYIYLLLMGLFVYGNLIRILMACSVIIRNFMISLPFNDPLKGRYMHLYGEGDGNYIQDDPSKLPIPPSKDEQFSNEKSNRPVHVTQKGLFPRYSHNETHNHTHNHNYNKVPFRLFSFKTFGLCLGVCGIGATLLLTRETHLQTQATHLQTQAIVDDTKASVLQSHITLLENKVISKEKFFELHPELEDKKNTYIKDEKNK